MIDSFPCCVVLKDGFNELFEVVIGESEEPTGATKSEKSWIIYTMQETFLPLVEQTILTHGMTMLNVKTTRQFLIPQSNYLRSILVMKKSYFTSGQHCSFLFYQLVVIVL